MDGKASQRVTINLVINWELSRIDRDEFHLAVDDYLYA